MISVPQVSAPLSAELSQNIERLGERLGRSSDVVIHRLEGPCAVVYIDGLADPVAVNEHMIKPLMAAGSRLAAEPPEQRLDLIRASIVCVGDLDTLREWQELLEALLDGSTLILVDGCSACCSAGTPGWDRRSVEEPKTQTVVRGPKESFTETLRTNTSLLRRKIKSPDLRFLSLRIGRYTQTLVNVVYLEGVAKDEIVQEIMQRLEKIETDSILESCYIEEFIEDSPFSPFPTLSNTERPDAAAAGILEGQVAILVDGTPFVLLGPVTFFTFLQSSEDYYQRYDIATFIRLIRYVSFFVSMLLPAAYIAITTFHQEMLPTTLLISLAAQREGVPFPALVEAMLMEITFEVLREAGIRMPRVVGPAISIVGALVLGQAAVQAGLVSAAMIIVVSFTAISNFVMPALNITVAARLIRFALMILAATLGLFGIVAGIMTLLIHMVSIRSLGVPYMTPVAPLELSALKDVVIRMPWWSMKSRPRMNGSPNVRRQGSGQQPAPPPTSAQSSDGKEGQS